MRKDLDLAMEVGFRLDLRGFDEEVAKLVAKPSSTEKREPQHLVKYRIEDERDVEDVTMRVMVGRWRPHRFERAGQYSKGADR